MKRFREENTFWNVLLAPVSINHRITRLIYISLISLFTEAAIGCRFWPCSPSPEEPGLGGTGFLIGSVLGFLARTNWDTEIRMRRTTAVGQTVRLVLSANPRVSNSHRTAIRPASLLYLVTDWLNRNKRQKRYCRIANSRSLGITLV